MMSKPAAHSKYQGAQLILSIKAHALDGAK